MRSIGLMTPPDRAVGTVSGPAYRRALLHTRRSRFQCHRSEQSRLWICAPVCGQGVRDPKQREANIRDVGGITQRSALCAGAENQRGGPIHRPVNPVDNQRRLCTAAVDKNSVGVAPAHGMSSPDVVASQWHSARYRPHIWALRPESARQMPLSTCEHALLRLRSSKKERNGITDLWAQVSTTPKCPRRRSIGRGIVEHQHFQRQPRVDIAPQVREGLARGR